MRVGEGSYLNVRAKPKTSSERLARLKDGTRVKVLSKEGDWYQIAWSTITGYVYKDYIRKD